MTPRRPPEPVAPSGVPADYRRSHLDPGKGESYQDAFARNPYRSMIWGLEKRILDRLLDTDFEGRPIRHLDFACGTGRILAYVADRAEVSVGVDVSPSMLAVAKAGAGRSELIEADLTASDVLGDRGFNLITAFRFFPNAQPSLREEAMRVLLKHLSPGGWLVFNNHKNSGSFKARLARLRRRGGTEGMSAAEVRALLDGNGLKIARQRSIGIAPASERHLLLPAALLRPLEAFLSDRPFLRGWGEDVIYCCRRSVEP